VRIVDRFLGKKRKRCQAAGLGRLWLPKPFLVRLAIALDKFNAHPTTCSECGTRLVIRHVKRLGEVEVYDIECPCCGRRYGGWLGR